jgi:two-component system cell cycle sensor histidine kinase/response regulator CckA
MIRKILIVDDNSTNLYLLEALLTGHGMTVVTAENGRDALDKARSNPPDLVVTDILMPVMDGYALCREWKADERLRHIPLVFYTATYTEAKDEEFALSLGADRFIIKPQEPDVFMNLITEFLGNNYAARQVKAKPLGEEMEYFRQHNEILFKKLEKKMMDLEAVNRKLSILEERYRLRFQNVMDVLYTIDMDLNVLDVSPSVERILGYKPQDFIGRPISGLSNIFAPESFAQAVSDASLILKGESIPVTFYRFIAKDGTEKIGEVSGSPMLREGRIIGMISVARDVTAHKQAEEALRESEEKYRSLFENLQDAIFLTRPDGSILEVNQAACKMFGRSADEIKAIGRNGLVDVTDPRLPAALNERDRTGKASAEITMLRANGEKFPADITSTIFTDINGERKTSMIIRDTTERKKAEEALRESEERYRNVFENHSAIKFLIDPDTGRIIEANEAAVKYYGWPQERLKQMMIQEINTLPPEDVRQEMEKALAKKQTYYEFRHRRADGSIRDVEVFSSTVNIKGKRLLHSIVHDITERKTAEEALRESEEVFRLLFEKSSDAHLLIDKGRYIDCNEAAMRIAGYPDKSMIVNHTPADLSPEKQPDGELSHEKSKRMMEIAVKEGTHRFEWVRRQPDGKERHLEVTLTLIPMKGRKLLHTTWRDITEQIRIQKEQERLQSQLIQAQKMEAIGTLAGGIAHDFNNILTGIIGYTELYMDKVRDRPQVHQGMEQILKASERARDLVRQILTFSRKAEHEKKPISLVPIVDEIVHFMRASLPTTIEIKSKIESTSDIIMGDPSHIHQVLVNLCTNAGHAMRDSGGVLQIGLEKVHISADDLLHIPSIGGGNYLLMTVRDTGHGISREYLERIFEPYFTTKEKGEGTGLGLAVVHGIVKDHGGEIKVYSAVGTGTEFRIYLPVVEHHSEDRQDREETIPPGKGETILFVDDEQMVVDMNRSALEMLGYKVVTETDPLKAVEVFKRDYDSFDMVITDKTMPHMTGFDLARIVKSIRSDMPVIISSGFQEKGDLEKTAAIGISRLIIKPTKRSILAETIRDELDNKLKIKKT